MIPTAGPLVRAALLGAVLVTAACAKPDPAITRGTPYDPWEESNRKNHAFNKALDRNVLRPAARGYSAFMADDVETAISRFSENLSLPRSIVNNILQGNGLGATTDTYRFVVNTTLGLGGFFDPATELEMPANTDADFGQTLYTWGVNEGPYVERPFFGPATRRAAIGTVVDLFTDPINYVVPTPERYYGTAASVSSGLTSRGRFSDTIDSILYESADSYAATRSIYLQNRRFKLGMGRDDPYLDPYDTTPGASSSGADSVYEDPYDQ
ncbi:VacJ family lipoprotein [Roseovarius sp. SCSIO 43702]|uniref:MlaA family lipoprotein n=1 Tax=Roseovarius sp. SCSIO 43702 TaxID=2823043 RepID=UPI001C72C2B6|nr:VacJ family lipoprotein [Roseovarius sp. SCSIO 43702]QYX56607.1 VacJ family lipoprotein [Roseovarius sp. SCSIO 43702]